MARLGQRGREECVASEQKARFRRRPAAIGLERDLTVDNARNAVVARELLHTPWAPTGTECSRRTNQCQTLKTEYRSGSPSTCW